MPRASCSICRTRWEGEDVRMFHIPICKTRREIWMSASGTTFDKNSRVCEKHFVEDDFQSSTKAAAQTLKRRRLKSSAVPSINLTAKKPVRAWPEIDDKIRCQVKMDSSVALPVNLPRAPALAPIDFSIAVPEFKLLADVSHSAPQAIDPGEKLTIMNNGIGLPEMKHSMSEIRIETSDLPAGAAAQLPNSNLTLSTTSPANIRECLFLGNMDLSQLKIDQPAFATDSLDSHSLNIFSDLCQPGIEFSSSPGCSLFGDDNLFSLANSPSNDKNETIIKEIEGNNTQVAKNMKNVDVQTESDIMHAGAILETMRLQNLVRKLTNENEKLKSENFQLRDKLNGISNGVASIFTEGQIRKLMTPNKKIHWCADDMSSAIDLYAASRKAYMVLFEKGFPLPGIRTVNNWLQQIKDIVENK